MKATEIVKGELNWVCDVEIDIEKVVKKWNHLWVLSEWKSSNTFKLVKFTRKDSEITDFKFSISAAQAKSLISELKLMPIQSPIFKSGVTWKKINQ